MKKLIFVAIAAIVMLAGIQPVFAEQFTAPEISVSDNQCYVLDVPAGATDEICEYTAPWQETLEKQNLRASSGSFNSTNPIISINISNASYVAVVLNFTSIPTGSMIYITTTSPTETVLRLSDAIADIVDSHNEYVDSWYHSGLTNITIEMTSPLGGKIKGTYYVNTY
jgi:hypothetical protein